MRYGTLVCTLWPFGCVCSAARLFSFSDATDATGPCLRAFLKHARIVCWRASKKTEDRGGGKVVSVPAAQLLLLRT